LTGFDDTPEKKKKKKKEEKEGGVGGSPPTFKLFSPPSLTIRQNHYHTETRRPGITFFLFSAFSFVLLRD
jgi:hypothetical protein